MIVDFYGYKVGDTRFIDVPQLSGRYNMNVSVKDESGNELSGTFKDRRSISVLEQDAGITGKKAYVQISCGNSALSMGRACQIYSRATRQECEALSFIGKETPDFIRNALQSYSGIQEIDLKAGIVPNNTLGELAQGIAGGNGHNVAYRVVERVGNGDGYASLAQELFPAEADCWFVPVGEGELMTQLILASRDFPKKPVIIGATIDDNAIGRGKNFLKSAKRSPADKLVAPYSDYNEYLRDLCKEYGHSIVTVSDRQIMTEYRYLKELGIKSEPSAAAAFAGARKWARSHMLQPHTRAVIINTGKGLYEEPKSGYASSPLGFISVGILAAALLYSGANYSASKLSDLRHRYQSVAEQEMRDIEALKNQRKYLIGSIQDPIEAFAWYKAEIKPLERERGTFLNPETRRFVMVPDHGKSGLIRGHKEGQQYDSFMWSAVRTAEKSYEEFLEKRARFLEEVRKGKGYWEAEIK